MIDVAITFLNTPTSPFFLSNPPATLDPLLLPGPALTPELVLTRRISRLIAPI